MTPREAPSSDERITAGERIEEKVIESPDFYYFIHKEQKIGMKGMDNLTQVVATRLKSPEK